MKLNPFGKKEEKKEKKPRAKKADVAVPTEASESVVVVDAKAASTNRVLKHFYISEKATMLSAFNQYVFKVHALANKSEIKKQVHKIFNVDVADVKILNMPEKRRDMGRHPGMKSGFKKAIVTLKDGQSIQQGQQKI